MGFTGSQLPRRDMRGRLPFRAPQLWLSAGALAGDLVGAWPEGPASGGPPATPGGDGHLGGSSWML